MSKKFIVLLVSVSIVKLSLLLNELSLFNIISRFVFVMGSMITNMSSMNLLHNKIL